MLRFTNCWVGFATLMLKEIGLDYLHLRSWLFAENCVICKIWISRYVMFAGIHTWARVKHLAARYTLNKHGDSEGISGFI